MPLQQIYIIIFSFSYITYAIQDLYSSSDSDPVNLLPSFISNLELYFLKSLTLPDIPVLPEVQKGIIVLLLKS